MFEKNIYVRQAEVKASMKQNASGTFLIGELTVNSSLKNYERILHEAFEITLKEIETQNNKYDAKTKTVVKKPKEIKPKTEKNVKGLN